MSASIPDYLLTSESVSEGHPDKVADQVSDAVLDFALARDPRARVACETLVTRDRVVVAGEACVAGLSAGSLNAAVPVIVRERLRAAGYGDAASGIDVDGCRVESLLDGQSGEIADRVERGDGELGAGDQGVMFGYATDETPERLPLSVVLAHRLLRRLAAVRRDGSLGYLRPDAKSLVTVAYRDGQPIRPVRVVVSTQHAQGITPDRLRRDVLDRVVAPCLEPAWPVPDDVTVNGFTVGGPAADTGLTGRKIVVDTYGGSCPHGGGAFSGKDATKVDRTGAYAARWVARHVVDAGLARRVTVQLAYGIGDPRPVVQLTTHGTGRVPDARLLQAVEAVFDLSLAALVDALALRRPVFTTTAAYGHFGRQGEAFTWERTPLVERLREAAGGGARAAS